MAMTAAVQIIILRQSASKGRIFFMQIIRYKGKTVFIRGWFKKNPHPRGERGQGGSTG
jgi:hypothetical protein